MNIPRVPASHPRPGRGLALWPRLGGFVVGVSHGLHDPNWVFLLWHVRRPVKLSGNGTACQGWCCCRGGVLDSSGSRFEQGGGFASSVVHRSDLGEMAERTATTARVLQAPHWVFAQRRGFTSCGVRIGASVCGASASGRGGSYGLHTQVL